jgi:hypothetical protein
LLIFIFWGGLSIVGVMLRFPIIDYLRREYCLYAGSMVYPTNTGFVYWIFNQTITPWLIISIILNRVPKKNLFFIYVFCLFQGPFAFLGLFPFVVYLTFQQSRNNKLDKYNIINKLKQYASFQNSIGFLNILMVVLLYFSANKSSRHLVILSRNPFLYLFFITLEFGVISLLILKKFKKEPVFFIILFSLVIIPFFQIGYGLDFCARVCIPSLFILMIFVYKYIIEEKNKIIKVLLLICLFLGSLSALKEITRSVVFVFFHHISQTDIGYHLSKSNNKYVQIVGEKMVNAKSKNYLIKDDLKTLSNPKNNRMNNFIAETDSSFFYNYMAKKQ